MWSLNRFHQRVGSQQHTEPVLMLYNGECVFRLHTKEDELLATEGNSNTPPVATGNRTPIVAGKINIAGKEHRILTLWLVRPKAAVLGQCFFKEATSLWQTLQISNYFLSYQLTKIEQVTRTDFQGREMRSLKQEKKKDGYARAREAHTREPTQGYPGREFSLRKNGHNYFLKMIITLLKTHYCSLWRKWGF